MSPDGGAPDLTPERWQRVKRLFDAALAVEPAARAAWLDSSCAGDPVLRREVESMLASDAEAESGPLSQPLLTALEEGAGPSSLALSLAPAAPTPKGHRLRDLEGEAALPEIKLGVEKYQVLELLGEGGMGQVHLAYDSDLGRRVALKVAHESAPSRARLLLAEARILARLEHPGIVPIHEVGLTPSGRLFYTMPVVEGRTLRDVIQALRSSESDAEREWSLLRRVQVLIAVGQAMAYAHAKGVVHRDLKPANVMLGAHGEVLVLDWGLSELFAPGASGAGNPAEADAEGAARVTGTPGYMAPEQARGEPADGRTDVWALGVMLYELLCLAKPFDGESSKEILEAVRTEQPVNPRRRSPDRHIPFELESICLRALRKSCDERFAGAEGMVRALGDWLEAEADRSKLAERAAGKAAEGRTKLAAYRREAQELVVLERTARDMERRFAGWLPASEKGPLLAAWNRAAAARKAVAQAAADAVRTLESALEIDRGCAAARELLGDYYWDRFREAEARGDADARDFFCERVSGYHDGKYARELDGVGSLTVSSHPLGAEVTLHAMVERGFELVPGPGRVLGRTPLRTIPLAMGSWVLVFRREGYRDTHYPVSIARNHDWVGAVRLRCDRELGEGMCYVPGGPFLQGGDAASQWSLPLAEPTLADFAIATYPVTMAEYLEFLNALVRSEGVEAAERRAPRTSRDAPSRLLRSADGGLGLPLQDAEGERWDPRQPVFGISRDDALAYCAWRARREGRPLRLPSEVEWEKAARGVDGRAYPWGSRFDPSLCNMNQSHKDGTRIVTVDAFPSDVSIYGVRGMAGNIRDRTASNEQGSAGGGERVLAVGRGGAWNGDRRHARCANRGPREATSVDDNWGFRLAVSFSAEDEGGSGA